MTVFCVLFANVAAGEQPIIISDVLLTERVRHSSGGQRYEKTYIPSVGGMFPQISTRASISGLVQKTYVLESGHCVALSGDFESVQKFHRDISSRMKVDEIVEICLRYQDKLQFAALIHEPEVERLFVCATESCRQLSPGSYGLVLVGGRGHSTLRSLLIRHQDLPFKGDPGMEKIGRALCLISEALDMDESSPAETLGERFGAYYEITAFTGSEFTKIGNVAYHYLTLDFRDDSNRWMLKKSYYHEYLRSDLIVRRVLWAKDNDRSVVWQDCYIIGGLEKPVDMVGATQWIQNTAPAPFLEVLCVKVGQSKFRFVAKRRHVVRIRKEGDEWFPDVDEELIGPFSRTIWAALQGES